MDFRKLTVLLADLFQFVGQSPLSAFDNLFLLFEAVGLLMQVRLSSIQLPLPVAQFILCTIVLIIHFGLGGQFHFLDFQLGFLQPRADITFRLTADRVSLLPGFILPNH